MAAVSQLMVSLDWLTLRFSDTSTERAFADEWRGAMPAPSRLVCCFLFALHMYLVFQSGLACGWTKVGFSLPSLLVLGGMFVSSRREHDGTLWRPGDRGRMLARCDAAYQWCLTLLYAETALFHALAYAGYVQPLGELDHAQVHQTCIVLAIYILSGHATLHAFRGRVALLLCGASLALYSPAHVGTLLSALFCSELLGWTLQVNFRSLHLAAMQATAAADHTRKSELEHLQEENQHMREEIVNARSALTVRTAATLQLSTAMLQMCG
jgi:hypothetical protein